MTIKLLIADDHEVVRSGLKSLVSGTDIKVVAEAETGESAVKLALKLVAATGCAFLMVTHSTRLAAKLERQVLLSSGVLEKP